jgi:hypothetical protein
MQPITRTLSVLVFLSTIILCATNCKIASASQSRAISEPTTGSALNISTTSLPNGTTSSAYSATLSATGGTSPYRWSITSCSGACNAGLSLSTAGAFSGTPTNAGTSTYEFMVTDTAGITTSASIPLTISAPGASVTVSISPTTTVLNTGVTQQFSVSGTTNSGVTWSVNGIQGGNSTLGIISATGLYTAPSTVPAGGSVTTAAGSTYDSAQSATATVSITPAPSSSSGSWSGWNFGTPTIYASPSGSGTACTSSAPCSLSYASNTKATPGSVIEAAAGTYAFRSNALVLSASGSAGKPIVLPCVNTRACFITGTRTGNSTLLQVAGNYITLDGFDISNVNSAIPNSNMAIYVTGTNNIFSRNAIHDVQVDCSSDLGGGGVQVAANACYNTFDANLVYNIGNKNPTCKAGTTVQFDGILAETTGTGGTTITNNIIYNVHGGWGIVLGGGSGGGIAANNLVFQNGNGGIVVRPGSATAIVSNNIIADNGADYDGCGIYYLGSTAAAISTLNNSIYGNTGGNFCQYDMTGAPTNSGDITSASFVNWQLNGSGDYREASGSQTIDAGTSTGAPDHDFAGNLRPGGNAIDIGPYEYH